MLLPVQVQLLGGGGVALTLCAVQPATVGLRGKSAWGAHCFSTHGAMAFPPSLSAIASSPPPFSHLRRQCWAAAHRTSRVMAAVALTRSGIAKMHCVALASLRADDGCLYPWGRSVHRASGRRAWGGGWGALLEACRAALWREANPRTRRSERLRSIAY